MSIQRTYVLEKNENIAVLLGALGLKEDKVAKMVAAVPTLDFNLSGDKLTIISKHDGVVNENNLTLGAPSTYKLAGGMELEVNLTLTGNIAKGSLKKGDRTGEVTLNISPEALVETFVIGGITAVRTYKKA